MMEAYINPNYVVRENEKAMVKDRDGNEIYLGETCGECQKWCRENGIDGSNGEYIAIGTIDEDNYFETEDYEEIDPYYWGVISRTDANPANVVNGSEDNTAATCSP